MAWEPPGRKSKLQVVLFSGGRGSRVLSQQLINNPRIALTLVVNGYDDGLSTGEVRKFLGDSLGPSDFRKNASRLARELKTCAPELIELVDLRLPATFGADEAARAFRLVEGRPPGASDPFLDRLRSLAARLDEGARAAVAGRLARFEHERTTTGRPFVFADCSVGNLVFAGFLLDNGRQFNLAIAQYCRLLGLPPDLVQNVTDGGNAYLVALDLDGRLLGSEGEIVDAKRRNRIRDIYLIDHAISDDERRELAARAEPELRAFLAAHETAVRANPVVLDRIAAADLIIYSPGTQHSSLFPSYLTPGLSRAIASNLIAVKLLITNIRTDAEIAGASAVDIIERAVYYLKEKDRLNVPTPSLITHYLINDPGRAEPEEPYIPLGRLESLEDPRLVRVGNYEDGVTGRHDAERILTPFIESFLARAHRVNVAVWLYDSESRNKVSQTILEMVRAGIHNLPVTVTVFYSRVGAFDPAFTDLLPFTVVYLGDGPGADRRVAETLAPGDFDYVILFESAGMYNGEDIVSLASHLTFGRLDAAWGSRRLSVRDIHASFRLRYRHNVILGAISYVGSHLLSLGYVVLYGRYISDTLSGARAVRTGYVLDRDVDLSDKLVNQRLLSMLLRHEAEILETPVQFLPISPERVRRTSVLEGLRSLAAIVWWRFRGIRGAAGAAPAAGRDPRSEPVAAGPVTGPPMGR